MRAKLIRHNLDNKITKDISTRKYIYFTEGYDRIGKLPNLYQHGEASQPAN